MSTIQSNAMNRWFMSGVLGVAVGMVLPATSGAVAVNDAYFTHINAPLGAGEDHQSIFDHIYNTTFSLDSNGLDFTGANGIIVKRVADGRTGGNATAIGQLDGDQNRVTDAFWQDGFFSVTAEAKFAELGQQLGLYGDAQGGAYEPVLTLQGDRFAVDQTPVTVPDMDGSDFRWAKSGPHWTFNSDPTQNADGMDHLVTYVVRNIPGQDPDVKTFMLFWEDLNAHDNSVDWDYNDLVVEVNATYGPPSTPEPASLSVIAMAGAALMHRRRRTAN